jgi:hypothetical protein
MTYSVTVKEKLDELERERLALVDRVTKLEMLQKEVPDLEINTNRWRTERYSSQSVNSIVDNVEIGYNCGCCSDSPVEAWPFVDRAGERIFSKPASFQVGEKGYDYVDRPHDGWRKQLTAAGIADVVIEKIATYFRVQREERIAELQQDGYYDGEDDE